MILREVENIHPVIKLNFLKAWKHKKIKGNSDSKEEFLKYLSISVKFSKIIFCLDQCPWWFHVHNA